MPSINAAIVVNHLSKIVDSSESALTILQQISFAIPEGDSVAIIGSSGSGKSTLLGLLAGLDVPSEGSVQLLGHDLSSLDEDARAAIRQQYVGFVFQSFQLLPHLTALENVLLPVSLAGKEHHQMDEMLANYEQDIQKHKLTEKRLLEKEKTLNTYDLILNTDTETYIAVETGKINPQEAFMTGKIKVSDLMKMMEFGGLFKRL